MKASCAWIHSVSWGWAILEKCLLVKELQQGLTDCLLSQLLSVNQTKNNYSRRLRRARVLPRGEPACRLKESKITEFLSSTNLCRWLYTGAVLCPRCLSLRDFSKSLGKIGFQQSHFFVCRTESTHPFSCGSMAFWAWWGGWHRRRLGSFKISWRISGRTAT